METPISPKVIVAVIVGILLTSAVSNVAAITPDMFDFLGPWKLFVFGTLITALIGLAAWWKTDPLRILPADAAAAKEAADSAMAAKQTSIAATAAPASSFAPTQAKLDALPAVDPLAAAQATIDSLPA